MVLWSLKRPNDHEHLFRTPVVVVPTHLGSGDDRERASGCQEGVSGFLRFLDRHRVKDVRQGSPDELADAFYERSIGQFTVEDVRCSEGEEQVLVVERGGRDDGRETGQRGELNR